MDGTTSPHVNTLLADADKLDCPMCGARESFTIDPEDGSRGHCEVEDKTWVLRKTLEIQCAGCASGRVTVSAELRDEKGLLCDECSYDASMDWSGSPRESRLE
jgi:hypothetical protein